MGTFREEERLRLSDRNSILRRKLMFTVTAGFATCLVRYVRVRYMFATNIQCRAQVFGREVLVYDPVLTSPNTMFTLH